MECLTGRFLDITQRPPSFKSFLQNLDVTKLNREDYRNLNPDSEFYLLNLQRANEITQVVINNPQETFYGDKKLLEKLPYGTQIKKTQRTSPPQYSYAIGLADEVYTKNHLETISHITQLVSMNLDKESEGGENVREEGNVLDIQVGQNWVIHFIIDKRDNRRVSAFLVPTELPNYSSDWRERKFVQMGERVQLDALQSRFLEAAKTNFSIHKLLVLTEHPLNLGKIEEVTANLEAHGWEQADQHYDVEDADGVIIRAFQYSNATENDPTLLVRQRYAAKEENAFIQVEATASQVLRQQFRDAFEERLGTKLDEVITSRFKDPETELIDLSVASVAWKAMQELSHITPNKNFEEEYGWFYAKVLGKVIEHIKNYSQLQNISANLEDMLESYQALKNEDTKGLKVKVDWDPSGVKLAVHRSLLGN